MKKQIQRGLYDPNQEDPFELIIVQKDVQWFYHRDTQNILGTTCGMCVEQDFEAITPNILARTIVP
jgi:N-acetyltransferase 10